MDINKIAELTTGSIKQNESMAAHTTFRTGGCADYYISPNNANEAAALIRYFRAENYPFFVLGNGSNMLISDQGYRGAILDLGKNEGTDFSKVEYSWNGDSLKLDAGAGCYLSELGSLAVTLGATGFEELSGIPGCVGGGCIMNAGAYGREMVNVVTAVQAIDPEGELVRLEKDQLQFRYRGSNLMDEGYIVCRAEMELTRGKQEEIKNKCEELLEKRRSSQPLEYPSAGSTFKRPEGYFAGKLISDAGLKGFAVGDAEVSTKHAGFVINKGNASSADVYELIKKVQKIILEKDGVELVPEVRFLGEFK